MAIEEVDALKKARKLFVQVRRRLAASMNSAAVTGPGPEDSISYVTQSKQIQAAIEALDRAIKDEGGLPPGAYLGIRTSISPVSTPHALWCHALRGLVSVMALRSVGREGLASTPPNLPTPRSVECSQGRLATCYDRCATPMPWPAASRPPAPSTPINKVWA